METESIDKRLLSILEDDPQASLGAIAERAGIAEPTARKYIEKLEDEGVIVDYTVETDPKKLDHRSIAIVGIDVESDRYIEATAELEGIDTVTGLYTATGDHMLMAELEADDSAELNEVISDRILAIDGVTAACPAILQERLK